MRTQKFMELSSEAGSAAELVDLYGKALSRLGLGAGEKPPRAARPSAKGWAEARSLFRQFYSAFLTLQKKPRRVPRVSLDDRQRVILLWCARGKTRKEIGRIVGLSEGTVKFHMARIMKKLAANNMKLAVSRAIQQGLIKI